MRSFLRIAILGVVIYQLFLQSFAFAEDSCASANRDFKQDRERKIRELERQLRNSKGHNPLEHYVRSKSCVLRVIKLGLAANGEVLSTPERLADLENNIACMRLELFFIDKKCECNKTNQEYLDDNTLREEIYSSYDKIQKLEDKVIGKIPLNESIRSMIQGARKIKDCVNRNTLTTLARTTATLEALAEQLNSPESAPADYQAPLSPPTVASPQVSPSNITRDPPSTNLQPEQFINGYFAPGSPNNPRSGNSPAQTPAQPSSPHGAPPTRPSDLTGVGGTPGGANPGAPANPAVSNPSVPVANSSPPSNSAGAGATPGGIRLNIKPESTEKDLSDIRRRALKNLQKAD